MTARQAEARGAGARQGVAWFTRLGQSLDGGDLSSARAYLTALGLGAGIDIAVVTSRGDAEAIIRSPDWDPRWWDVESAECERLQAQAQSALGRNAVLDHLSALMTAQNDVLQAAAEAHLDADPALSRAAAGAIALALHQQAVARLADAGRDHLFMRKCRLFAQGRWPLGVVRQTFHLF